MTSFTDKMQLLSKIARCSHQSITDQIRPYWGINSLTTRSALSKILKNVSMSKNTLVT